SNKKIRKLENQLEEERQLNYSFDKPVNDRHKVNVQEETFTEEPKDIDQEQENEHPTEVQHKDVAEEEKDDSIKEDEFKKDEQLYEEIESETSDRVEQHPK